MLTRLLAVAALALPIPALAQSLTPDETTRIDTLIRLGLVAPYGGARSTGGRPPALFALNPSAKLVVGVDIGATHARAALTDLDGKILGEADAQIEGLPVRVVRRLPRTPSR